MHSKDIFRACGPARRSGDSADRRSAAVGSWRGGKYTGIGGLVSKAVLTEVLKDAGELGFKLRPGGELSIRRNKAKPKVLKKVLKIERELARNSDMVETGYADLFRKIQKTFGGTGSRFTPGLKVRSGSLPTQLGPGTIFYQGPGLGTFSLDRQQSGSMAISALGRKIKKEIWWFCLGPPYGAQIGIDGPASRSKGMAG